MELTDRNSVLFPEVALIGAGISLCVMIRTLTYRGAFAYVAPKPAALSSTPHGAGVGRPVMHCDHTGILLALHTARLNLSDPPPASGWDICLLLT